LLREIFGDVSWRQSVLCGTTQLFIAPKEDLDAIVVVSDALAINLHTSKFRANRRSISSMPDMEKMRLSLSK
jgi:hypothetical protein